MKAVFVATSTENIAVEYLSSYIKRAGHGCELVFDPQIFDSEALKFKRIANFLDVKKQIVKQVVEKSPDIICFSVFTINYQRSLELARDIKKQLPNVPIVFGGVHTTSVPERVIKQEVVDIVCVGEGEQALVELLDNKNRTDIHNMWFKKDGDIIKNPLRPLISDLDNLPFADKQIFHNVYEGFTKDYYALSSRGCPFKCTFCANHVLHKVYGGLGPTIRRRSADNMVNELALAKKKFKIKKVTFVDDVFVQNTGWLEKFADRYVKEVKLPYMVLTHPSFLSERAVKILKESGCYFISLGLQTADQENRRNILKRFDTNEQIKLAADWCHKHNLRFSIDHIFNIPSEGKKEYEYALTFYNRLRPSVINSFWLQYFPKTEIIKKGIVECVIKEEDIEKIEEGKTSTSVVVGLGGKDDFSPELIYKNYQFWFMVLPLLSKKAMQRIIDKKIYLKNINPPLFVNIFIKFIANIFIGRAGIYIGIIKSSIYFMFKNLKLKIRYGK